MYSVAAWWVGAAVYFTAPMSQVAQLSPELARSLSALARALLVAARNWALYPPEHPAVDLSVTRLTDAIRQSSLGSVFSIGITPDTLMVEGASADRTQAVIAEAAALLHDRDLLQVTFVGDVPPEAVRGFLQLLALDPAERRQRGGPARIWGATGHPSLALEQIDYQKVFAREEGEVPEPARRDDLWRSIVVSIAGGQRAIFDERVQRRLLAIAGSSADIADLATAAMAPKCAVDGSPMITTQAATVLAAFRHLANAMSVAAPERLPEVMGNLASAAAQLDPHVMMQVLQTEDDPGDRLGIVHGLSAAFDDVKVAQLLATALALDGQASGRLATVFNAIAPDPERKARVLTLTRGLLSELDFGRSGQFQVLWQSVEELLLSYNDAPFVSSAYRTALDNVGGRAERMAAGDLPPELPDWMATLGQASVRSLSVLLLIDLLALERDPERAASIASDMAALAEDLVLSGAYADARSVVRALAERAQATSGSGGGRDACRAALDRFGESTAMREAAQLIGDLDEPDWQVLRDVMETTGPSTIEVLKPIVAVEAPTAASERAATLIVAFGARAIGRLGSLVEDSRWCAHRAAARLLGRIAVPEAVPLLQPLLRRGDPRVAHDAVSALAGIDDPSAARAIHTVLRTATGALRQAVVDALVTDKDPRVVPVLGRIIEESEPLGKDHDVVLDTLGALGLVGSDRAVPIVAGTIARRGIFRRRRLRALKERGVAALEGIGTTAAAAALEHASQTGDRMLRRIISARRG